MKPASNEAAKTQRLALNSRRAKPRAKIANSLPIPQAYIHYMCGCERAFSQVERKEKTNAGLRNIEIQPPVRVYSPNKRINTEFICERRRSTDNLPKVPMHFQHSAYADVHHFDFRTSPGYWPAVGPSSGSCHIAAALGAALHLVAEKESERCSVACRP